MIEIVSIILIALSIICGMVFENMNTVSTAAMDSASKAVELVIYLSGSMALWNGLMKVAEKSGLTRKLSIIISPITKRLLKDTHENPKACDAVNMNIIANLFGLGNASTPLGIKAMKELNKSYSPYKKRNLALFTLLNTASIQLLPTTVASIRLAHGSHKPFDILPQVLMTSLISVVIGCLTAYALYLPKERRD